VNSAGPRDGQRLPRAAAHPRFHDRVEEGPRTGDAADVGHRSAVEVARPYGDRDRAGEADRPVVAVAFRRARLRPHLERKVEHRLLAEGADAGVVVLEDIDDEIRVALAHHSPPGDGLERVRADRAARVLDARDEAERSIEAPARKGRVGAGELEQGDLAVAPGPARPVVRPVAPERREPELAEAFEEGLDADLLDGPHGGNVQRAP